MWKSTSEAEVASREVDREAIERWEDEGGRALALDFGTTGATAVVPDGVDFSQPVEPTLRL